MHNLDSNLDENINIQVVHEEGYDNSIGYFGSKSKNDNQAIIWTTEQ